MSDKECDLYSCYSNETGICGPSKVFPEEHEFHFEPVSCWHYQFIQRERRNKECGGENGQ